MYWGRSEGGQNFSVQDPSGGQKRSASSEGGGKFLVHTIFGFAPPHLP